MVKVVIVDDSRVVQEFMTHLLSSDGGIEVIGVAGSGEEAIEMVRERKPDVVTMDIHMPGMNGYEATRTIMETAPTPIIIVSGSTGVNDASNSFKLFEAGALAVVLRPPSMENPEFEESRRMLIRTVKLMSEVKVVRRFPGRPGSANRLSKSSPRSAEFRNEVRLIAIGASTGGPVVLQTILSNLPERFPVPVLIVQHIAKGFVKGFRDWLAATSKIDLRIAVDGDILKPGTGYIAPDGHHLGVKNGMRILLKESASDNGICPSADFLFGSVNDQFGASAVGVLLTGMGKDGARELKSMKNAGAVTIVQDEATCVVFGMPGEAVRIGAAEYILAPDKIAKMLTSLIEQ